MRLVKYLGLLIISLIFLLLVFSFIVHNPADVIVDLLFLPPVETKLAFWLIGFFVLGGLSGLLASLPIMLKEKAARIRLERRLQNTSKIISSYTS